jgi:hypothetical protein
MRRVTPAGPGVVGGWLVGVAGGSVAVGSAAWLEFLTAPGIDTRAFTFPAAAPGELHRAYREWRRSAPWQPVGEEQPYWYVRVRIGAKVRRFYLGAPADIDGARLEAVAAAIAAARAAIGAPS